MTQTCVFILVRQLCTKVKFCPQEGPFQAGFTMGHRFPSGHPVGRVAPFTHFWPTSGIPEDEVSRRKLCSLSPVPSAILVTSAFEARGHLNRGTCRVLIEEEVAV